MKCRILCCTIKFVKIVMQKALAIVLKKLENKKHKRNADIRLYECNKVQTNAIVVGRLKEVPD